MQQSREDHRIVPGFELVALLLDPSCMGSGECERCSSFKNLHVMGGSGLMGVKIQGQLQEGF